MLPLYNLYQPDLPDKEYQEEQVNCQENTIENKKQNLSKIETNLHYFFMYLPPDILGIG